MLEGDKCKIDGQTLKWYSCLAILPSPRLQSLTIQFCVKCYCFLLQTKGDISENASIFLKSDLENLKIYTSFELLPIPLNSFQ